MILRRLIPSALVCATVLAGACGGGGGGGDIESASGGDPAKTSGDTATTAGGESAATGSSGSKDCDELIAKADLDAAFGVTFAAAEKTPNTPGTTICSYDQDGGEGFTSITITYKPSSAGEYDATLEASTERGAKATPIDGVGDKGVVLSLTNSGITVYQVMFVKGSALVFTTAGDDDQTASVEVAKKIAANV